MQLSQEATQASGNAEANQLKYTESFAGKMQSISTQIDEFWLKTLNNDVTRGFLDMLNGLMEGVNALGDVFGHSTVAIAGFFTALSAVGPLQQLIRGLTQFGKGNLLVQAFGKVNCPTMVYAIAA